MRKQEKKNDKKTVVWTKKQQKFHDSQEKQFYDYYNFTKKRKKRVKNL